MTTPAPDAHTPTPPTPPTPVRIRKRPLDVEAMYFDGSAQSATPIIDWVLSHGGTASFYCQVSNSERCEGTTGENAPHSIQIRTLEGSFNAPADWWVVRGVAGEFYACKDSILRDSYDFIEAPAVETPAEDPRVRAHDVLSEMLGSVLATIESGPANTERVNAISGALDSALNELRELATLVGDDEPAELIEDQDGAPLPAEVQDTQRFFLYRTDDVTGVHEDGVIAVGVQFNDSTTVLHWLPGRNGGSGSTAVWPSFADAIATHTHPNSNTRLVWF